MADTSLPTQELPPWLTYSYITYTNTAGALTTATTILQLPLTYYGPSIPLGPDWTYGGLTSPAVTSTAPPTSTTPPTTTPTTFTSPTTATPTTSSLPTSTLTSTSSFIPTSTTPSMTSSSSSSASSSISSSFTFSSSGLPTSTGTSSDKGLNGKQIAAIVLGVVAFLLLLLILVTCIVLRRRRVQRSTIARSGTTWKDFAPVLAPSPSGSFSSFILAGDSDRSMRPLGEGSPRHSGEEADPLLRPSQGTPQMTQLHRSSPAAVWAVNPANDQHIFLRHSRSTKSGGDGGDSDPFADELGMARPRDISHHPGYGTPRADEDSPLLPPRPLDPDGLGLPPRTHDSGVHVDPAHVPPRLVPPRRVQISELGAFGSRSHSGSSDAIPSSDSDSAQHGSRDPEKGALLMPQTPQDREAGPSTPHPTPSTPTPRPGWMPNLGLARFSQLSWLSRVPSSPAPASPRPSSSTRSRRSRSRSRSRPGSGVWAALSGEDDEPVLGGTPPLRIRTRSGLLAAPTAERPRSTVSAKSGKSSVYHSAQESLGSQNSRGSRANEVPPVPALPAAVAQTQSMRDRGHARTPSPLIQQSTTPPSQHEPAPAPSSSPAPTSTQHQQAMLDILDMPVPSANTTFSSSASSSRPRPSFLAMPPGLPAFPTPAVWADVGGSATPSPSSQGGNRFSTVGDLLDAEPPRAGDVWRSLTDARDRGKVANAALPTLVHQPHHRASLPGSVHSRLSHPHRSSDSLHSHFASSPRAAGVLPLSLSPFGSPSGSSRSRPSQHSHGASIVSHAPSSAGGASLAHSRSVSEDGRRRARGTRSDAGETPPLSAAPSLSAFGITDSSLGRSLARPSALRPGNPFAERIAARRANEDAEAAGMHT